MDTRNEKVDAFLDKAKAWQPEMRRLRAILLDSPLIEDFKWYKPCYTYNGSNVVILAGLKNHCWLAFLKGALMQDPDGLLEKPGENSQSGRVIKFTGLAQIEAMSDTLTAYINDAVAVEKAGLKLAPTSNAAQALPEELIRRLADDADLKAAFDALTPGRQRGYRLHFSQAKQSKTREARIDKCVPRILDGKGMNDR